MYVCICNALTDKQIRAALNDPGCSAAKVYARLGCTPQCGKCVPHVRDLVRRSRAVPANTDAALLAAE